MKKYLLLLSLLALPLITHGASNPCAVDAGCTGVKSWPIGPAWISTSLINGTSSPLIASSSPTVGYLTATSTTASSTFGYSINLLSGCFAVNNTCITGGGGSGTVTGTGILNTMAYWTGVSSLGETTTPTVDAIIATSSTKNSLFYSNVGIGNWLRIGGLTAPNNTTAGDLTSQRLFVGNTAIGAASRVADVRGTMTDTANGAVVFSDFINSIAPLSDSLSDFRSMNFQNTIDTPSGVAVDNVEAGHFEGARFGSTADGLITSIKGINTWGAVAATGGSAVSNITSIWGLQAVGVTTPSGTSVINASTTIGVDAQGISTGFTTTTDSIALRALNDGTGNNITNEYGLDVQAITRGTTKNTGVRIGEPSGASNNYALNLSGTGGTQASGITFGVDTDLYRSQANTLVTDGRLGVGTTAPAAIVGINAPAGTDSLVIGSSTDTYLRVTRLGSTVIGGQLSDTFINSGQFPFYIVGKSVTSADRSGGQVMISSGSDAQNNLIGGFASGGTANNPSTTTANSIPLSLIADVYQYGDYRQIGGFVFDIDGDPTGGATYYGKAILDVQNSSSTEANRMVLSTTTLSTSGNLSVDGTATSTFVNGINLTGGVGCYAINGSCVGGSGGGSGTVTSISAGTGITLTPNPITTTGSVALTVPVTVANGGTATTTFVNGGVVFSDGTKLTQDPLNFFWDNTNNRLGIGSTSPAVDLVVQKSASSPQIAIAASGTGGHQYRIISTDNTAGISGGKLSFFDQNTGVHDLTIGPIGNFGIGSTTPQAKLSVEGDTVIHGLAAIGNVSTSTNNQLNVSIAKTTNVTTLAVSANNDSTGGANGSGGLAGVFTGNSSGVGINAFGVGGSNSGDGAGNNIGVYGESLGTGSGDNFGVYGKATGNTGVNIGGLFQMTTNTSGNDFGIRVDAVGSGSGDRGVQINDNVGGANVSTALRVDTDSTANGGGLTVNGGSVLFDDLAGTGTRCVHVSSTGLLSPAAADCSTGGSGTVTSVAATVPAGFTISGSPVTTSGTLAIGFSASGNSILTSNSAGTGVVATGTQLTVGNLLATTTATSTFRGDVNARNLAASAQGTGCAQFGAGGYLFSTGSACGSGGGGVSDWVVKSLFGLTLLTPSTTPYTIYNPFTASAVGAGANALFPTTFPNMAVATGTMGSKYTVVGGFGSADFVAGVFGSASSTVDTPASTTVGVLGFNSSSVDGIGVAGIGGQAGVEGVAYNPGSIALGGICLDPTCVALFAQGNSLLTGTLTVTATTTVPSIEIADQLISEGGVQYHLIEDATGTAVSLSDNIHGATDTGSHSYIYTLPDASLAGISNLVHEFTFKDEGGGASASNFIKILPVNSQTIDGAASLNITTAYQSRTIYSNGTEWFIK